MGWVEIDNSYDSTFWWAKGISAAGALLASLLLGVRRRTDVRAADVADSRVALHWIALARPANIWLCYGRERPDSTEFTSMTETDLYNVRQF